jgi:hypothetical protein
MILPTQVEYPSTKVINAKELPDFYQTLINFSGVEKSDFPVDKTVMYLREGGEKSRLELISGERFMSIEKRGNNSVVIRDLNLSDNVIGVESIFNHDGNYIKSNIRVESGVKGTPSYSTFGPPLEHETGLIDFCKAKLLEVMRLQSLAKEKFKAVLVSKGIKYQGGYYPELVDAFVKVMGLDSKAFTPNNTLMEFRRIEGGDIDVVTASTPNFSASMQVEAEKGTWLTLTWQGKSGWSSNQYDNYSHTVVITHGRFETKEGKSIAVTSEAGHPVTLSDGDRLRRQEAYKLYHEVLSFC